MIRTIPTIVTARVAPASSLNINTVVNSNRFNIVKAKVAPSIIDGSTSTLEIFKKDTFLDADLAYKALNFANAFFDPIEDQSGVAVERNEGHVAVYQDLDSSGELHSRITNNSATIPKTYNIDLVVDDLSNERLTVQELTGLSGASVTASNLIPAGAIVLGVLVEVTTAITGATSFDVGDGATANRWGDNIAITLGTKTDLTDTTDTSVPIFPAANNVVLTAVGSNFTAGAVRITVHYIDLK